MVSAYWSPAAAEAKVHEAVANHPKKNALLAKAARLYDSKSAISVKVSDLSLHVVLAF